MHCEDAKYKEAIVRKLIFFLGVSVFLILLVTPGVAAPAVSSVDVSVMVAVQQSLSTVALAVESDATTAGVITPRLQPPYTPTGPRRPHWEDGDKHPDKGKKEPPGKPDKIQAEAALTLEEVTIQPPWE